MDEQTKAELSQKSLDNKVPVNESESRSLTQDSNSDGLTDRQEALLGTDPYSVDTDRDGVSDLQEVLLGTDPNSPDIDSDRIKGGNELRNGAKLDSVKPVQQLPEQIEEKQSFPPSLDVNLEQDLPSQEPVEAKPDILNDEPTSVAQHPPVIDDIYNRLQHRANLDLNNVTLAVYQGSELLYRSKLQSVEVDNLSPQIQDILQKTLDDPTGLRGDLAIRINGQAIFQVENGELKLDQYGLAGNHQVVEVQAQNQSASSKPEFDPSAIHKRYSQEVNRDSQSTTDISPIDAFEHIAQTALDDGLSSEQTEQLLKQDPFYQSFALGMGQEQADRYSTSLVNSLVDKGKAQSELRTLEHSVKSLQSSSGSSNRTDALEERIKNLESFNQQLSSQLNTVNQKIDKLSQSKAFQSQSLGLNQFFGKVSQSITDTLQATKNVLRQKAGEVSLSLIDATAKKSVQWFGEEASGGLRVIDSTKNDKRIGVNRQGDLWLSKSPNLPAATQYQRLSEQVDKSLPPSLQLKQIAQAALKEQFTSPQIQSVLSQSPKFQEISSKQGVDKANQFASAAIAAAQRQNLIDARPQQQSQHKQKQAQA